MHEIGSLLEVLRLARAEGALEGDRLEAFAEGLRARAELVIEERVGRSESELRRLEGEVAWRRETIAGQEETIRQLAQENAWRQETTATLQAELGALRAERDSSAQAHDHLLAHHRDVLGRAAAELTAVADLSFLSWRKARRRLAALATALRGEIG